MQRLGHWALCAGLPVVVILYAPLGPLALAMLLLPLYLHYLYFSNISCCYFPFYKVNVYLPRKLPTYDLRDPEPRKLAEGLPLHTAKAKAPSTTERHSRAFQKYKEWSACFVEFVSLSSDELSVSLYLRLLLQQSFLYSALESACYGINWPHNLHGFPSPCD